MLQGTSLGFSFSIHVSSSCCLPCSSRMNNSTMRTFSLWICWLMSLGISGITQSTKSLMNITRFCRENSDCGWGWRCLENALASAWCPHHLCTLLMYPYLLVSPVHSTCAPSPVYPTYAPVHPTCVLPPIHPTCALICTSSPVCPTYTLPPVYLFHMAKPIPSLSVPVCAPIPLGFSFSEGINGTRRCSPWRPGVLLFEKLGMKPVLALHCPLLAYLRNLNFSM